MLKRVKVIFTTICLLLTAMTASAQQVSFTASAPQIVAVGEVFRLELNLNAIPDDFTQPVLNGVEILAGPSSSQGQSISIINGKRTSSVSFTYTYVLQANKVGVITIPSAEAVIDGKRYTSKSIKIEVVAEGSSTSGGGSGGGSATVSGSRSGESAVQNKSSLSSDDVIVRVIPSRTNVYKGEPIVVSVKLYTRVPLAAIEGAKYPAFNGFWTQDLSVEKYDWKRENYKNKVYDARVIREYILYPQRAGKLQIEQLDIDIVAQLVTQNTNRRQSIFDDFFGGGQSVENVRRKIVASPTNITVRELPAGAPAGFNGAVGKFTMQAGINASTLGANSAGTYTVKLNGSGNMPLISAPLLTLPSSFEQYNVKTEEKVTTGTTGSIGSKTFEYPFIARAEGKYTIEPMTFSYFDPSSRKYVTLTSETFPIEITPDVTGGVSGGMVSGINKEEIEILGSDIRFIHSDKQKFTTRGTFFVWSGIYVGLLILILLLFVFALIFLQKQIRERQNMVLVKGRAAGKKAKKIFKKAEASMTAGDQRDFYDQMLKALWGYISDKLNIDQALLTKENIKEKMTAKGIDSECSEQYIKLISECEFAQYAPAASSQMGEVYAHATDMISELESKISKK